LESQIKEENQTVRQRGTSPNAKQGEISRHSEQRKKHSESRKTSKAFVDLTYQQYV
jgi:hypothetical protein